MYLVSCLCFESATCTAMPSCGSPICHSLAIKRGPKYATLILAAAFILTVVRSFAMLQVDLETVHVDSELHSLQVYGFTSIYTEI